MKRALFTVALCAAFSFSVFAQEPMPAKPGYLSRYFKDKPVLTFTATHAAANFTDGLSTKHWEKAGPGCESGYFRIVLDCRPSWARMAPLGAAEVIGFSFLAHSMHQGRHGWLRRAWWVPQTVSITLHTRAVAYNYRGRKDTIGAMWDRPETGNCVAKTCRSGHP